MVLVEPPAISMVERISRSAVLIEIYFNDTPLGTATGFTSSTENGPSVLLTNRHVVTERDAFTDRILDERYAAIPNRLMIWRNAFDGQTREPTWVSYEVKLRNEHDDPLWVEHPTIRADVVGLPLKPCGATDVWVDFEQDPLLCIAPPMAVSVIGFPFGKTAGGFRGIWVSGTIATPPHIDYDGHPCFLVDSRTRRGQSGSPVFIYSQGAMPNAGGQLLGEFAQFVGMYSGRIHPDSDLGMVWAPGVIAAVLQRATRHVVQPTP